MLLQSFRAIKSMLPFLKRLNNNILKFGTLSSQEIFDFENGKIQDFMKSEAGSISPSIALLEDICIESLASKPMSESNSGGEVNYTSTDLYEYKFERTDDQYLISRKSNKEEEEGKEFTQLCDLSSILSNLPVTYYLENIIPSHDHNYLLIMLENVDEFEITRAMVLDTTSKNWAFLDLSKIITQEGWQEFEKEDSRMAELYSGFRNEEEFLISNVEVEKGEKKGDMLGPSISSISWLLVPPPKFTIDGVEQDVPKQWMDDCHYFLLTIRNRKMRSCSAFRLCINIDKIFSTSSSSNANYLITNENGLKKISIPFLKSKDDLMIGDIIVPEKNEKVNVEIKMTKSGKRCMIYRGTNSMGEGYMFCPNSFLILRCLLSGGMKEGVFIYLDQGLEDWILILKTNECSIQLSFPIGYDENHEIGKIQFLSDWLYKNAEEILKNKDRKDSFRLDKLDVSVLSMRIYQSHEVLVDQDIFQSHLVSYHFAHPIQTPESQQQQQQEEKDSSSWLGSISNLFKSSSGGEEEKEESNEEEKSSIIDGCLIRTIVSSCDMHDMRNGSTSSKSIEFPPYITSIMPSPNSNIHQPIISFDVSSPFMPSKFYFSQFFF